MITLLSDHDCEGQVKLLWKALKSENWVDLLDLEIATFRDLGLSVESNDRTVWRFVQANRLLLLTNNRNQEDETALQATISRENTLDSLPVLTFANIDRLRYRNYRIRCATRVADIILDLDNNLGTGRLFIP